MNRGALGRQATASNFGSFKLPRREASGVQPKAVDPELVRRALFEFDFDLSLGAADHFPTDGTRLSTARRAERPVRGPDWQFARTERFAGFFTQSRLIGHSDASFDRLCPFTAQRQPITGEQVKRLHDLRFLGRRATLGQSYFDALEIPRREAVRVQVVAADLRLPLGPTSEFELELHFTARHQVATCRTRLSHAPVAEHAARSGRWQSATQDCFARFISEDWIVGHGSAASISSGAACLVLVRRFLLHRAGLGA
jgi:hypothetical protein